MTPTSEPLILLTRRLDEEQAQRISAIAPGARIIGETELSADPGLVQDITICYPKLPAELWSKAAHLKWLQTDTAGLDSLLASLEIREHPAILTNVHIHADCIAEHLWGMTLMLTRNLHRAARLQAQGTWDRGSTIAGLSTLSGRTLCIAGLGVIGTRCAALGRAFGMRVIGISRHARPNPCAEEVVGPDARREAFARARVIMLLLPDTPDTRGFVGAPEIEAMKGAYLLNAGRGSSINTDALVEGLSNGRLRGAGLDVTDPEPLPAGHPLWSMPNVIITPHYAGVHPRLRRGSL
ncbi:MAG: D-2-hydroxyacid dehydrogenase [Spirochaetia bacterium]|jgi:phosphoglycerate dehydrogenase-like enzyme